MIIANDEQRSGKYPTKNILFDILSLADQLYWSKSTNPDGPKYRKIYFSKNQMPNLLIQRNKLLYFNIHSYNKLVEKQALQMFILEEKAMQICQKL